MLFQKRLLRTLLEISLTPPLFIAVPVPSQESERLCICVLVVSILFLSTILLFDDGIVPIAWYFLFFNILYVILIQYSAREIFRLSTGIFRKYPSQTWYVCLITPNIT